MTAKTCSRVGPASDDPTATLIKDHGRLAEPKDWDEARTAAHAAVSPLPALRVPLAQALGAVVAEGVHARVASPIADRSAMDGFAVCGPPPWRVVARLRAGERCDERLRPGTACEVVTGAPVPAATDAVLPYEQSSRDGSAVTGQIDRGRHIRRAGEECAAGEQVLSAGHLVTPATLGFVATLGRDTLPIHPSPVVQAFITGDELVHEGHAREGRVRDAIGPMLPGLIHGAGARSREPVWLADNARLLAESICAADASLILVTGSSSRGPADHLRSVLDGLGARWIVDGVRCRPGHPQAMAGLADGRVVVGLPGNPYAALVAFITLALPALTGMRGLPLPTLPPARGDASWKPRPGITRLLPAMRTGDRLDQIEHGGSAMLRGVATADALAVLTPDGRLRSHLIPGAVIA